MSHFEVVRLGSLQLFRRRSLYFLSIFGFGVFFDCTVTSAGVHESGSVLESPCTLLVQVLSVATVPFSCLEWYFA